MTSSLGCKSWSPKMRYASPSHRYIGSASVISLEYEPEARKPVVFVDDAVDTDDFLAFVDLERLAQLVTVSLEVESGSGLHVAVFVTAEAQVAYLDPVFVEQGNVAHFGHEFRLRFLVRRQQARAVGLGHVLRRDHLPKPALVFLREVVKLLVGMVQACLLELRRQVAIGELALHGADGTADRLGDHAFERD